MNEEWKPVVGFPDYAVSSLGRVKRIVPDYVGRVGGILKPTRSGRYVGITLYKNCEPFFFHVHRIVCEAFHGDPPSGRYHAAHGDGDGLNNRSDNLRWATPVENEADKKAHGRSLLGRPSWVPVERRPRGERHGRHTKPEASARGEKIGTSKLTAEKVFAIRADSRSRKEIAADYGITVTMVGYIVRGLSWSHLTDKRV